jgi:hypothetical protein
MSAGTPVIQSISWFNSVPPGKSLPSESFPIQHSSDIIIPSDTTQSSYYQSREIIHKNSVAWVRRRELHRPNDRRLSAKLVPTLADRERRVVSATNPPVLNFGFLDRSRYFLEIAPQLSSRGWVDPVLDPLLLRKSGSAGNGTRTFDL